MCKKLIYLIYFVLVLGLFGSVAQARLLVHEPFDYAPIGESINGQSGEALGLSGAWVTITGGPITEFLLVDDLGPHGLLPTTGNAVQRLSPGRSSAHRSIDGSVVLPPTTWFSFLFRVVQGSLGHSAFAISSSPINGETSPADLVSSGHAFGFTTHVNDQPVRAAIWSNNTVATVSSNGLDVSIGSDIRLIVGKIEFDAGTGGNDILTLYDVGTDLVLPQPFATVEADADQSLVNTISIHGNRELSFDEIRIGGTLRDVLGLPSDIASGPNPPDKETDVPRDMSISWTPGPFAETHDVYFGTNFDDVNAATNLDPLGPDKVYRAHQGVNSYAVPETLDFGQTYYWRVDEVNGPPDYTVYKGQIWSFTTEPIGYPIENITATASSAQLADTGPENTINGSGLDDNDLHSTEETGVWLSDIEPLGAWIEFQFDKVYKLHEMWVWNSNQRVESLLGYGFKDVTIEYSTNGTDYATLGATHEFAQAPGAPGYAHNTTVDLGGAAAKYVRLTANSNWGGVMAQYGLSEVRFFYIPVRAREPSPDSGATDVDLDVTLGFRAGREAAQHDVYLGTDEQAVIDGTAPVTTVTEASYGPLSLDLGATYYWKINEVNMAETPTMLDGDVWNFTTPEFLVVDDFESYNDLDPEDPNSNRIFNAWIDGLDQPLNGSVVGYPAVPFAEQSIVHSGDQSMPLFYDNSGTARYSEAELTLNPPQDWTKHSVNALSLWFSGEPNNMPDQMYVKINGSKIAYDGDAGNLTLRPWQPWNIDLASLGIGLQNVTKLSIGFGDEASMTPGGSGVVYVDDIRLYPYSRQLVTPAEPGIAGLVAHYEFEGNTNDSSGNGLHGTAMGEPTFAVGKIGQVISLDGTDDYVEITGYKGILGSHAFSITAWIKTTESAGALVGWGNAVNTERVEFRINNNRLRVQHGGGNVQGDTGVNDGGWHHVAVTVQESATISYPDVVLYVDGIDDTRPAMGPDAFNITANDDVKIGRRHNKGAWWFTGSIDEVRIYDNALSHAEVQWLAGRTAPFDKPF